MTDNILSIEDVRVAIQGAEVIACKPGQVTYRFDRNAITASELIGRLSAHYQIRDLQVREPQIEETVRRIYEERLLDPTGGMD